MKKIFCKVKEKIGERFIFSFKKKEKKVQNAKRNKVIKYSLCIIIPCLLALGGAFLGTLQKEKKNKDNDIIVEVVSNKVQRRIYLISSDDLTIPLTVEKEKRDTLQEEIYDVFNLLKTSSKASSSSIKGFINDKTKLNSFTLENNILTMDFSKEFLDYGSFNESRILEALTLSFVQFEEIEGITLLIEGSKINHLPRQNVKVDEVLTLKKGINNIFQSTLEIVEKEKTIVFYEKDYDSKTFLVPLSLYAEKGETSNITFVNGVNYILPAKLGLKKIEEYNVLSKKQISSTSSFALQVKKELLIDSTYVDKKLFDLITLSLDLLDIDLPVAFLNEEEQIPVQGVYDQESIQVNSIMYNEIKI